MGWLVRTQRSVALLRIGALVLGWLVFAPPPVLAGRAIPDDNLAYPVLISGGGIRGSGFFFSVKDYIYLVTAKHVLFDVSKPDLRTSQVEILSYPPDPNDQTRNVYLLDLAVLKKAGHIKPHPAADVVVVRIAKMGDSSNDKRRLSALPGVEFKESATGGIVGTDLKMLKEFKDVLVGNETILFGYPSSLGIPNIPQIDYFRPLLRRGMVAGLNRQNKSIILDCPSYPGNSGGPAIELDPEGLSTRFRVIGVVSQFVPWVNSALGNTTVSNSGHSVVTPMDFVLELFKCNLGGQLWPACHGADASSN
jgi:hypothetical protein